MSRAAEIFARRLLGVLLSMLLCSSSLVAAPGSRVDISAQTAVREIRIGYIERSFSPSEREAIEETFAYLQRRLPQYRFTVRRYLVRDLDGAIESADIDYYLGASGFYRRVLRRGVRDLATMTTRLAPDPNYAIGTVFLVPKNSPVKNLEDMRGLRAAVNWREGFSGLHIPLGEVAAHGYDPDHFFKVVEAGSPMRELLLAVRRGEADVAMARACTLEELRVTEPELADEFRAVGLKSEPEGFGCLHSTDLYPNWTFSSTASAPWQASRDITAALLSMPPTRNGTGWGVVSDFNKVDELYRTLRIGPYEYLRIRSVKDFFARYWGFFAFAGFFIAGLALHNWRTTRLVRVRTRELKLALEKEWEAERHAQDVQQRLEAVERISVIGAMSSLITHELNGPLSAIANGCNALQRHFENDPPSPLTRKVFDLVERQCARAATIVNHVRSYARQRETLLQPVDCVEAVREIVRLQQRKAEGLTLRFETACERVVVDAHPLEFDLCVTNLVKNAREVCRERQGTEVVVKVCADVNKVTITVSDNACEQEGERIEDIRPLKSTKSGGLGMGLVIVRTIVEKSGGSLSLERRDNQTVARIQLPRQEEAAATEDAKR